jgi:hypothetical protein
MSFSRTLYRPDSSKFSPLYLPNVVSEMTKGEQGPIGPAGIDFMNLSFRRKTFWTNFHPKILNEFPPKNNIYKL